MELWQYYRILRKHRWLILIGTLICVGLVAGVLYLRPERHEAFTTVVERTPDRTDVNIFSGTYLQLDPRIRLANLMELAGSAGVKQDAFTELSSTGLVSDVKAARIIKSLKVLPVRDTMILRLSVESEDRTAATAALNYIRSSFMKRYSDLNHGGIAGMQVFISEEMAKAKQRLDEVREELRKYKEESGAVMLSSQSTILVQQLAEMETNLAQFEVQANQAGARLRSLEKQLDQYPATRKSASTVQSNPVWQQLQMDLARQQVELQKMLKDRTTEHPDVQALQQQIDETQRRLREAGATIIGTETETVNPIRDALVQSYITALAEYSSANAATSALQEEIAALSPKLRALPAKQARLDELTIEEQSAQSTYALLRTKLDEAAIKAKEAETVSALQIVDATDAQPADKRKLLKVILASILGFILASGISFLLNYLDNSVKTPEEAEGLLKMPVFAAVPLARGHSLANMKALPAVGASYQMLSANLWIKSGEMQSRTILVASAQPDVGRSTTAANLAITLARDGARVILVDSDLRQPSMHTIFDLDNEKGLSNVLAGQLPLRDALKMTDIPDLLLITSGPLPVNPVRLLRSPEMENFVAEINELADFVIFDSPAGIAFADATLVASLVKNIVLVQAAGAVPRGAEDEFRNRLEQVQANFVGAVLNMVKPEDSHGYYHFRSAYGELLREGKQLAALPGSATGSTEDS